MSPRISNQSSFESVDLADCIVLKKDETKEQGIKAVEMAMKVACDEAVRKQARALAQAHKEIKTHIPDFEAPMRVVVHNLGVIECSTSDRDGFEVEATTIYRKAPKLD